MIKEIKQKFNDDLIDVYMNEKGIIVKHKESSKKVL